MTCAKICCIGSVEEARLAADAGASAIGLVSEMPSGPGVIPEALIAEIASAVPSPTATFLLTSKQDPVEIAAQHRRCRTDTIQIVDSLPAGAHAQLRRELPGIALVQVVHVLGDVSIDEARRIAPDVDAILLDSGGQSASVKELGGTGRTHDWSVSAEIVRAVQVPVYLAGGLMAENVGAAIEAVQPFGVDVCSGVREGGLLDEWKLRQFMAAVNGT